SAWHPGPRSDARPASPRAPTSGACATGLATILSWLPCLLLKINTNNTSVLREIPNERMLLQEVKLLLLRLGVLDQPADRLQAIALIGVGDITGPFELAAAVL